PAAGCCEGRDIVQLATQAARYFLFAAGEPTANFLKVILPELRIEMRAARFRASQNQETIFTASQEIGVDGKVEAVVVEVRPMRSTDAAKGFFLVLFHEQHGAAVAPAAPAPDETVTRSLDEA